MSTSVTKIVNLSQAALKFLVRDEIDDEPVPEYKNTVGGVLSDGDYAWLAHGPLLEVVATKTGNKLGAWVFGWNPKDATAEVVCVDEIQRPHMRLPLLAVGVNCERNDGMICIFDFASSKVIRAIHITDKITNLHVIDSGYDIFTLPGPLRNFDGIIAVGTVGGDVHLIDICRQICDEALTLAGCSEVRNELNPCQTNTITSRDVSKIEIHKEYAVRNSHHLAIHLNVVFDKTTRHFTLKGHKGDDRVHVNKAEVTVSALCYCSQLGSLLVGYNFGALQLFSLMTLKLVYTSPVCDEHIPISHFAIQEPADDPKAVCYIWAVYSNDEQYATCLPLAVMYSFSYNTKEYHEGYGFLYQDFISASIQFQTELGVIGADKKPKGGACLKVKSISQGYINREGPHSDSQEDNITLCAFVWKVCYRHKKTDTFLAVFDLNQWYKEQMPTVSNVQYTSYMIQFHLNELLCSATGRDAPILDILADRNSFQQFVGAQRLEAHFLPNSLSFKMTCLRDSDITFVQNYGIQKALLARIESLGPLCLVEPAEIFQEIIESGLTPLYIDLPTNTPVSTNQQREIILGAALENRLLGWLCKCASDWANGSFISAGCSLEFLMTWAFRRAVVLKSQCDEFCVPLFDYSGLRLDNNTNVLLNSSTRQLNNLCSLFGFVLGRFPMFISNLDLVSKQFKSLQTVFVYFDVLQWLSNVGLLPECLISTYPRSDDLGRINAPYPAEILSEFYNHRRAVLKALNEEYFGRSESVLFIDFLIEKDCGGKILQEQWCNDGGNGLYPPPSLQALLRTYLVDDVELCFKHLVVMYVFLDLAMALEQDHYKSVITHLIKFPAVFKVSSSVIKITQAFWQLDHGDFNTAMGLLLDPLVSAQDLKLWHHRTVLKSLIIQKQYNFALLYVQVRTPSFEEDDDILTVMSLYVANNMLDEAFYLEKRFPDSERRKKFLMQYFKECEKHNKLDKLIHRSFNPTDEKIFLLYLSSSKTPRAQDLHVHYHLLRSRFLEAFETHENSVPENMMLKGLKGKERAHSREKLIHTFKSLLPDVTRQVISFCKTEKYKGRQQDLPTPMSVFVLNSSENVKYKSSIIGAALSKARETFNETISDRFLLETEGTPFLRTPVVAVPSRSSSAVIVNPKFVDTLRESEDVGSPSSAKRLKFSPRHSLSLSSPIPSKLETPLVKRKIQRGRDSVDRMPSTTPQSILKVKTLINHTPTKSEGEFVDDFKEFKKLEYTPVTSSKKSGLGLSVRRSLAKSPVVRFEGVSSSLSSTLSSTQSPSNLNQSLGVSSIEQAPSSSKNTSTEEDIFYSPNGSLEESVQIKETAKPEATPTAGEDISEEKVSPPRLSPKDGHLNEVEEKTNSLVYSPRSRRSYKSLQSPVRSSPSVNKNDKISESRNNFKSDNLEHVQSRESSTILPKLRPRKSLCRKVLESNAIGRVLNSPKNQSTSFEVQKRESFANSPKAVEISNTTVQESSEKEILESSLNYSDGKETHKSVLITKHNLTMSMVESTADTSEEPSFDSIVNSLLSESMVRYLKSLNKSVSNSKVADHDDSASVSLDHAFKGNDVIEEHVNEIHDGSSQEQVVEQPEERNQTSITEIMEKLETEQGSCSVLSSDIEILAENDEGELMDVDEEAVEDTRTGDERTHNETEYSVYETLKNKNRTDGEDLGEQGTCDDDYFLQPQETNLIETEVPCEESYNQFSILEQDMAFISSTPLRVLEKNVIHVLDSSYAEEESNEEEDENDKAAIKNDEDEVIEIGSSTDEEKCDKSTNSDQSSDERLEVGYERNIYHTFAQGSVSESSCSQHCSEAYQSSDEGSRIAPIEQYGLFHGDIVVVEEDKADDVQQTKEGFVTDSKRADLPAPDRELLAGSEDLKVKDEEIKTRRIESGEEPSEEIIATEESQINEVNEGSCNRQQDDTMKGAVVDEFVVEENVFDDKEVDMVEVTISEEKVNDEQKAGKVILIQEKLNVSENIAVEAVEPKPVEEKSSAQDDTVEEIYKQKNSINKSVVDEDVENEVRKEEEKEYSSDHMDELVYSVYEEATVSEEAADGELIKKQTKDEKAAEETEVAGVEETTQENEEMDGSVSDPLEASLSPKESYEIPIEKRLTRGSVDVLEKLQSMQTPKRERERDIVDRLLTAKPIRILRTRAISTEENPTPTMTLRKRSASVSETPQSNETKTTKKETSSEKRKGASRPRSAMAKIVEEESDEKMSQSVADYSANRRVTRRQMKLLMETNVLPTSSTEKSPDLKGPDTPKKGAQPGRRTRSSSQASSSSQVSESGSVGQVGKRRTRRTSGEDASKTNLPETKPKEMEQSEQRVTRSRRRSVSSVNSEDSVSEVKVGRRNQRKASNSTLPDIKEEPEKPQIPKKRTRQNSSQI